MSEQINAVLTTDAKHRSVGVTDDLFKLSEFWYVDDSWDYSLPTIVSESEFGMNEESVIGARRSCLCSPDIFMIRLKQQNKLLYDTIQTEGLMNNLLIAGGYVSKLLRNRVTDQGDIDIFVYGLTHEEANLKVKTFYEKLYETYLKSLIETKRAEMNAKIKKIESNDESNKSKSKSTQKKKGNGKTFGFDTETLSKPKKKMAKAQTKKTVYYVSSDSDISHSSYSSDNDNDSDSNEEKIMEYENEEITKLRKEFNNTVFSLHENCIRTPNTIKIDLKGESYQIIFRLYSSSSEILHGFDLGSSAVGFDGNNVLFTSLSKLCYTYNCNIIDTTRRSTSYESRLIKYFKRGFALILPKFDITKLRRNYFKYNISEVCELPKFVFSYKKIYGNAIILDQFIHYDKTPHDYGTEIEDQYQVTHINTLSLINERRTHNNQLNLYHYKNGDWSYIKYKISDGVSVAKFVAKFVSGMICNPPSITREGLVRIYRKYQEKLSLLYRKSIPNQILFNYFVTEDTGELVKKMATLARKEYDELVNEIVEKNIAKSTALFDREIKDTDYSIFSWLLDNPGTQLTGSFNPIHERPSQWYGVYINEETVMG